MTDASRRGFLKGAFATGAAAASAGALSRCAPDINPAPYVDVADEQIVNGSVLLPIDKYPDLGKPGGAIILRSPQLPSWLLLIRLSDSIFKATSAICTHVGCPLGYDGKQIVCPCHLSTFDVAGRVTQAPATQPLQTYVASFDGTQVKVALGTATFPPIVEGKVTLPFSDFPQLQGACGIATGTPANGTRSILVVAKGDGTFNAVNPICPHQQCTVAYKCDQNGFECPCHLSRFSADGTVLTGPATKDLGKFEAVADSNGVTITVT